VRRAVLSLILFASAVLHAGERRPSGVRVTGVGSFAEGNAGITQITVVILNPTGGAGSVDGTYTTADGTATAADNDYIPKSGTFFIGQGQTQSAPIVLEIVGDPRVENNETFQFLVDFNGAPADPAPEIVTIANDDTPAIAITNAIATEGNSGLTGLGFVVTLTSPSAIPIEVSYQTASGSAISGADFQPLSGAFAFAPGITQQTLLVNIIADTVFEPDETMSLTATPLGGAGVTGIGTIVNDDAPAITVSNASVAEGNSGTTAMSFEVTLASALNTTLQVSYSAGGGTATSGVDYQAASGTLTFAGGTTRQTVTVNVIGDTLFEPDETFTLTVSAAGGAASTGTGTIVNDDRRPPARLIIVSGNNQSARLGQKLPQPLVVQLVDEAGGVIPGAAVQWRVTRGAAALDPAQTVTNSEGRASVNVTVNSVGAIDVEATAAGFSVTFNINSETGFESRATGPIAVPIARALDQFCARNEDLILAVCRALVNVSNEQLTRVLERAAPSHSGAQSKISSEIVSSITSGVRARLNARRSGHTPRFAIQSLSFGVDGKSIPLGMIATALMQEAPAEDDYTGWSAFLSASLGDGERSGESGFFDFELESRGLMFGVDKQIGAGILGASLNLMQFDAEMNEGAGSVETQGYALSLYGSRGGFFTSGAPSTGERLTFDGVHVDGSVTVGRHSFESERTFEIPALAVLNAKSENDATVFAAGAVTGLEMHRGRTDIDLSLSGTWSRVDIDELEESGAGPLVLFVQGHEIDSLSATASLDLRSAFAVPFGTLLPSIRAELVHEFKDSARVVTARFLRDRLGTSFTIPVDRPDANYGKLSAGLQGVFPCGVSAYIQVTQDLMRSDLEFRTIQFTVSKSF
jgi:uncharacterized protein YhjY with autotransporter beta-barrel domain